MLKSIRSPKEQVYKDGLLLIYSVKNIAPPGDTPEEDYTLKIETGFCDRIVGYQRRIAAMQVQSSCDRVVELEDPINPEIMQSDVAKIVDNRGNTDYYVIDIVDRIVGSKPEALRLQLRRRARW